MRALLTAEDADPDAYTPAFRQAIAMADLDRLLDDIRATVGPIGAIRLDGERFEADTETHLLTGRIVLDGDGRVALLFFEPPEVRVNDLEAATARLGGLGQDVAWLVTRDGAVLSEAEADRPLAVGSAFKLGVMAVLLDDIEAGVRDWADVVRLEAWHVSLPSGRLQEMPLGAPLTLHTLAALMISESDNTATDVLMDTLGRARVADALGVDFVLTTREFFVLKGRPDLGQAFKDGTGGDTLFADIEAAPLPKISDVLGPYDPEIEWTLPLTTLCAVIERVADHSILAINPGPLVAADWGSVAYKGGSEPGVLNFTAAMTDANGQRLCAALSVNDPGTIDLAEAQAAFRALTRKLAEPE